MRWPHQIPSHLTKDHAGLPRNLHLFTPLRSLDAIRRKQAGNTTRLKCYACHAKFRWTRPKCCAATKSAIWQRPKKYCARHEKRFSTRYPKGLNSLNATKCHACFAKLSYMMRETSNNGPSCSAYHRHGHTVLTTPVANGCEWLHTLAINRERLRTVANGCRRMRMVARR